MATMKDIAERAGVSIATVSHVINKTRYVSPQLVNKVKSAMEELGYSTNINSNVRYKRNNIIGVFVSDISGSSASRVIKGIEEVLSKYDYDIVVYRIDKNRFNEERFKTVLANARFQGLIVVSTYYTDKIIKNIEDLNIPVVFVNCRSNNIDSDVVVFDSKEAVFKAAKHLIKRGHERIAFINHLNDIASTDKLVGYKKALSKYAIKYQEELVINIDSDNTLNDSKKALKYLLDLENPPTAIICSNEKISIACLKTIEQSENECPKDISVIGLGNYEWSVITFPPLTTIDQHPHKAGKTAAEKMLDRIKNNEKANEEIIIPPSLIVRESTQVIGRGPFGEKAADPSVLELTEDEIELLRAGNYTAAISFHYSNNAWTRLHEQGLKDGFNRLGIKILAVTSAHFDPKLQIKQLESLLAMEPDILISIPTDEIKTAESYRKIADSKTKLILITNVPHGLSINDYITCVSVNERENGQNAGRILGEYLMRAGKKNVGIIRHGAPFFATKQRDDSAIQVISEEFPMLEIVAVDNFIRIENAYDTCMKMMKAHPEIEGIYVSWEGPAIEVINALCEINREDVAIVTADLDIEVAVNMARGGMIKGLSTQRPYEQGKAMALAAGNALLNKKVPSFIGVRPIKVTPENLLKAWQEVLLEKVPDEIRNALKEYPNLSISLK